VTERGETVFVTGGTGVLGRPAVQGLIAAGYRVRAVARGEAKATGLSAAGADPVAVDLFDLDALKAATEGSDAILHLATSIPRVRDMRKSRAWTTNNRLRTEATTNLLSTARIHGIASFVKESITFPYLDGASGWIDEAAPVTETASMRPTVAGEKLVEQFTAEGGRGVVLRFGSFLAPDAHHTDDYLRQARWRLAPFAGRPEGYTSSIHVDDAAAAVVAALAAPAGVYNVVDDEPLTRREGADAFAAAFGLGHLIVTPPWLFKLVAGRDAPYILASQRVSNRRFRDATGWAPACPSAREGWATVAAARRDDAIGRKKESGNA
jgi:nucleoside-diphosphate-sugar epimerase